MVPTADRLLIVSPVYNEAAHIDRTARAIAAQTRRPDRWVIVDDGSTDDTVAVARRWERELDFLTVIEAPQEVGPGADNLALARPPRAFNLGLEHAGWRDYEFAGKLDGDVELPPGWYETLLERFASDPRLGVAAGRLAEPTPAGWTKIPIPAIHVHGAVKLYRRGCLEAIGGIQERLGWDTIDETYARMRGFKAWSFPDLLAIHHRPLGSADGTVRGHARHGECAYIAHFTPTWIALRAFKVGRRRPVGLSGIAFFYGYVRAALRRVDRVPDPEFRRFTHMHLRRRMLAAVVSPLRGAR